MEDSTDNREDKSYLPKKKTNLRTNFEREERTTESVCKNENVRVREHMRERRMTESV